MRAYRAINTAMVAAYWEIGRIIVEQEQQGSNGPNTAKPSLPSSPVASSPNLARGSIHPTLAKMRAFLPRLSNF